MKKKKKNDFQNITFVELNGLAHQETLLHTKKTYRHIKKPNLENIFYVFGKFFVDLKNLLAHQDTFKTNECQTKCQICKKKQ